MRDHVVTMLSHTRHLLELPTVLGQLAEFTEFPLSRQQALQLEPMQDRAGILAALEETTQARNALKLVANLGIESSTDISAELDAAEKMNTLSPSVLLRIATTIRSGNRLRNKLERNAHAAPELAAQARHIAPLRSVMSAIVGSIADDNFILDSASPVLEALRSKSAAIQKSLLYQVQKLVTSPQHHRILQEPIFTERSGRYVLPIRQEARSLFNGIVHDVSSSGATVFMEPMELVQSNNEWRRIQIQEAKEEDRILRSLSLKVATSAVKARNNLQIIAELDLAFAKARYAEAISGVAPQISEDFSFDLIGARHPLVTKNVVGINIRIEGGNGGFRALIITGPNSGGKTVALKCVGLLHLMVACGLHVPVDEGSSLAPYKAIYADIGDEQSIEQNLSTFSSHMSSLLQMIVLADSTSLVLTDEIGAGTDPIEGACLAQAIVERLLTTGCALIATTHFGSLANFASSNPLTENASVNFDQQTLSPTFRISIGLPGQSNATEIATRLGLDELVVARARELAGADHWKTIALMDDIRQRSNAVEDLRQDAEKAASDVGEMRRHAEERNHVAAKRISTIERRIHRECQFLLQEMEAIVQEARRRSASAPDLTDLATKAQALGGQIEEVTRDMPISTTIDSAAAEWQPGDVVALQGIRKTGEILSVDALNHQAELSIGSMRMTVATEHLKLIHPKDGHPRPRKPEVILSPTTSTSIEYEIRGIRTEEVPYAVDQILDKALKAGARTIRIIHGSGTGALRAVVREYATDHPLIRTFSDAGPDDGGSGVTVALLND